jgi:hypothetical protein
MSLTARWNWGLDMSDINTSGSANPKPGTLINVGPRGRYSDYVLIGNYRIKQVRDGWLLYAAAGAAWDKPRKFRSKTLAVTAMVEHMTTGTISAQPATLAQRVAQLEQQVSELTARLR